VEATSVFVTVNATSAAAASAALCIVIWPVSFDSVTPVDFDVACEAFKPGDKVICQQNAPVIRAADRAQNGQLAHIHPHRRQRAVINPADRAGRLAHRGARARQIDGKALIMHMHHVYAV
jgi:hypothetical protein